MRFPLTVVRAFHNVRAFREDPRWPGWQVVIGIETHAQIKSRQKLFSGVDFHSFSQHAYFSVYFSDSLTSTLDDVPNKHVSPFDAAFPGTLPVRTVYFELIN